jgi:CPA2 family monovalent cation:H+ antiporter-2
MDAAHDLGIYGDAMVVLVTAAVLVPLIQRLRVSPILGFLIAGAVLGPSGLGALAGAMPALDWFTVTSKEALEPLAELGVVFLLFLIGLEVSLRRLVTMRRLVFGLGGLQVVLSASLIGAGMIATGYGSRDAAIIGLSFALSSTAIVVEILARQQRLATATGRATFSVLLFQDLAVVPLLLLVTILGPGREGSIVAGLAEAVGKAVLAVAVIVAVGSVVLRPLFRLVASSENTELFVAATLFVAVGSGLLSASLGLSMALGAFVAGLLLAETEFRRAIEATVDPFRGLLLGVFFFSVGMSLDIPWIVADPLLIGGGVLALAAVNALVVIALMRLYGFSWGPRVEAALLLGPSGEFAFIIATLSVLYSVITPETGALVQAMAALSMALIPLFDVLGRALARRLEKPAEPEPDPALALLPSEGDHVQAIVIGHGRVGELVSDMLGRHGISHVVTERNPAVVTEARAKGRPVYYGEAKNPQFLARCGLSSAAAVIITIHTWKEVDDLVLAVRSARPDVVLVVRARDAEHARHLYELGVTDAVPETIEASLQLSEATLVGLGVPVGPVIASIHEKRDEFRAALQGAAAKAGRTSRGLRAKAKERAQSRS